MQPVSEVNLLQQLSQENYFNSRAQQELSFSQRHRSNFSLSKLKLDNVKTIVADFDKATAIAAVKAVAKIAQQSQRREDTLCYLGNAEFSLLCPATNGIGATAGMNRIFKSLSSKKISIAGKQVPLTLSGAVYSCIASDVIELRQIYEWLDDGLKQAQSEGGNQIVSSNPTGEARTISVDRALQLIESQTTEELTEHARPMLIAVLPLLEFADDVLKLGLASVNKKLRARLTAAAEPDDR